MNCTGALNSNGSNYNQTDCGCNTGYFWNRGKCRPLDCGLVSNAMFSNNMGSFMVSACTCQSGFYYANGYCLRNCSAYSNTNQNGSVDGVSCQCNPPYFWNGTECSLVYLPYGNSGISIISQSGGTSGGSGITISQGSSSSGGGSTIINTGSFNTVNSRVYNCSLIPNSQPIPPTGPTCNCIPTF